MPNYINFLPKKFLFLHFYGYNHRMKYVSLTEFFSDNINLFINVIASLFALFFCFSVGFGLLFFITLPLGYIMGIVLSFPLLIFVSVSWRQFVEFLNRFGAFTAPLLLYSSHFSTHISYAALKW